MDRYVLEFIGGAWDGMNVCSDSADPIEAAIAGNCLLETWNGTLGKTVTMPPGYGTGRSSETGDTYAVVDRTEVGSEALVRLELCSRKQPKTHPCRLPRIVVEFRNGPLHGVKCDNRSSDVDEALLALSCYFLTQQGRLGSGVAGVRGTRKWTCRRDFGPKMLRCSVNDEYQLAERIEQVGEVLLRFEFRS